jgi:hypothetical protein
LAWAESAGWSKAWKKLLSKTLELFLPSALGWPKAAGLAGLLAGLGCVEQLGPEHPATATSLNYLAELYRVQGRYGEAVALSVRTPARVVRQPKAR